MISANRMYRESGSTLNFKDWLEREKAKGKFIPNVEAIEEYHNADGGMDESSESTITAKQVETNQMIRNVSRVVLIAVLAYAIYKVSPLNKK
jgi:hypothetical protein